MGRRRKPRTFFDTLVAKFGYEQAHFLDQFRRTAWSFSGYVPTPAQADWLFNPANTVLVSGGVRSGKSYSSTKKADWFLGLEGGLIWIIGPDYQQATMEFDYILDTYREVEQIEWVSRPQEGPCRLKIKDGATVETKTSDKLAKLAGKAPHFILMVEAGQQSDGAVGKVYERGLQEDATVVMTGTFEGANTWYEDAYKEFQIPDNPIGGASFSMPTWSNTHDFPGGKNDPKFKRLVHGLPHEIYMERVAAIPYQMSGRVIRGLDRMKHCVPLTREPSVPVFITTDPATHTYPVLFVQRLGNRVHVLDEIYRHNIITQDILPEVMAHDLYRYVEGVVMDQAGKQHHANRSVAQIWRETTGKPIFTRYVLERDNYEAINLRLQEDEEGIPRLLFNADRIAYRRYNQHTAGGILAEADLWRFPQVKAGKARRDKPVDANNDGMKSLGYFLYREFGPVVERRSPKRPKKRRAWYSKRGYYEDRRPQWINEDAVQ